jgi:hypothetical protein
MTYGMTVLVEDDLATARRRVEPAIGLLLAARLHRST